MKSIIEATVVKRSEKEHDVTIGSHIIGTSKTDFDARFHLHAINEALDEAYRAGQSASLAEVAGVETVQVMSEEEVAEVRKLWTPHTGGGQCKNCKGITTYARVNSHGLCMKCEGEKNGK